MTLAILWFKRVLTGVLLFLSGVFLMSCGGSSSTSNPPSGLKFRAFVSQSVSATTAAPGLIIVNAQLDQLTPTSVISAGPSPGLMTVTANHQLTLVFSSSDNEVNIVNNSTEASSGKVTLPSSTESMAATSDATLAFAAVPAAPVPGLAPGEVELINLTNGSLGAPVPNCVPTANDNCTTLRSNVFSGARFLVLSADNQHLLVFGDAIDSFAVVDLANIGTTSAPNWNVSGVTQITGTSGQLDHPTWAVFSQDGKTAYVLSCGTECGGTMSAVTPLNLTSKQLGTATVLSGGATYAATFGSTVYVAGSAECPTGGPSSCGKLSILNTSGNSIQLVKTADLTDGYHDRMAVTSDNQVFTGAQGCTSACLSIYNGNNGKAVIGTDSGDVTGIQPISGRPQVYVVENGELRNWTTTTDALAPSQHQMNIIGLAIDVKLVD